MNDVQAKILDIVRELLQRANKGDVEVTLDVPIHGDGIGLDSLETAEFSAILEDEYGTDPFGAGLMPETLADVAAFYTAGEDAGEPASA